MNLDAAACLLGALCLFPLAVALHGLYWTLVPGGVKFRPEPLTSQRGTFVVLVGISVAVGFAGQSPAFLLFVAVSTWAVAVQHLAPKAWGSGRVQGVCFSALGVEAIEREGSRVVLVLERGYRLVVPPTPYNEEFLAHLQEGDDER